MHRQEILELKLCSKKSFIKNNKMHLKSMDFFFSHQNTHKSRMFSCSVYFFLSFALLQQNFAPLHKIVALEKYKFTLKRGALLENCLKYLVLVD